MRCPGKIVLGRHQDTKEVRKWVKWIFGKEDSRQREQREQRHRSKSKVGMPEWLQKDQCG